MKIKTQKRANRTPRSKVAMPKARVMHLRKGFDHPETLWPFGWGGKEPFACRPCPTKSAAQAKVRFDNLGWEEKQKAILRALYDETGLEFAMSDADAVLHAIGERPERGGGES